MRERGKNAFIAIMAEGEEERPWLVSTPLRPKQFIPLVRGRFLSQLTVERDKSFVQETDVGCGPDFHKAKRKTSLSFQL